MEASVFTSNFLLFAEGGVSISPENNPFLKTPCLPVEREDQKFQGNAVLRTEAPSAEMEGSNY